MDKPSDDASIEVEQLPDREIVFTDLLRHRPLLFWAVVTLVGLGIAMFTLMNTADFAFFKPFLRLLPVFLGLGIFFIGNTMLRIEIRKRRRDHIDRFVDVDANARTRSLHEQHELLKELAKASVRADSVETASASHKQEPNRAEVAARQTFATYFDGIRKVLEAKANIADEKASFLLDKGTQYARRGIYFYVLSIGFWQYMAMKFGLQVQYVYGVVSCSLLFLIIEVLSAWYLKQYRHFVDTSTYLIKVKSIFDRYMLAFLTVNRLKDSDEDDFAKQEGASLLQLLSADIKWPDVAAASKGSETAFPGEAMVALAAAVKALSSANKPG